MKFLLSLLVGAVFCGTVATIGTALTSTGAEAFCFGVLATMNSVLCVKAVKWSAEALVTAKRHP